MHDDPQRPPASPSTSFRSLGPYLSRKLSRNQLKSDACEAGPPSPRRCTTIKGEGENIRTVLRRARSTTWTNDALSRSGPVTPKVNRAPRKPPPYAEAYRHAILHKKLEIALPTRELKRTGSFLSRYSRAVPSPASSTLPEHGSQQRRPSMSVTLATKIMMLSDDGYILQYNTEGASNRTPERILKLGEDSIAIASDELPGRHWVLNVVSVGRNVDLGVGNLVTSPRLSSLSIRNGQKRPQHVSGCLIAFADDSTFNEWLVAVRTEIEHLGGLEYDPDATAASSTPVPTSDVYSPVFPSAPFVRPFDAARRSPLQTNQFDGNTIPSRSTRRSSLYTDSDTERPCSPPYDRASTLSRSRSSSATSMRREDHADWNGNAFTSTELGHVPQPKRSWRPELTPIIIEPLATQGLASDPSSRPSSMLRTPTLASDAMHQMAGAFENPQTPSTPGASFSPSLAPFALTYMLEQTVDAPLSHEIVRASAQTPSPPPPPYTLAPQRRSSQKRAKDPEVEEGAGLGISELTRSSNADLSPVSPVTETPMLQENRPTIPIRLRRKDDDGSIWVPPAAPLRRVASTTRAGNRFFPVIPAGDEYVHAEQGSQDVAPAQGPRSGPLLQSPFREPRALRQQPSMPLLTAASTPFAPPPTCPLPAVPPTLPSSSLHDTCSPLPAAPVPSLSDANQTDNPPSGHGTRSTTNRSRGKPELPTLDTTRAARTREWVSPLSSNPLSPAEVKFARRLSTVNGFPVVNTEILPVG
jgi:hypothetical protein